MKVLINLSTLKKGGGQNVALNFLNVIKNKALLNSYFYFIAEGSLIHKFLIENNCTTFFVFSPNPIRRVLTEIFYSRYLLKKLKIDIIYTYFGIGLFPTKYPQVIGSADSNLFFPEIHFWKNHKGFSLLTKKIIDKYRIWGLYKADGIIFENSIMEARCHEVFETKALTTTILPSISLDFQEQEYSLPTTIRKSNIKKGLFLCGWHMNKNVMIIPFLALRMKELNIDFHFILTAPIDQSEMHEKFSELLSELNVESMVSIIGPIPKEALKSLYQQIDFVFLLSKLESFSNNIIEAWTYKKVLIVADEPWAHALCKDAAIYVDRDDDENIVQGLYDVLYSEENYLRIVTKGIHQQKLYPTAEEKYNQEISFLKKVYEST